MSRPNWLALAGSPSASGPVIAAVQATFEFFETDKATVKLLFRDAYAWGRSKKASRRNSDERFIDDIERRRCCRSTAR